MDIVRLFFRGLREIARELSLVKSVVRPKNRSLPRPGVVEEVLDYLADEHLLRAAALFDPAGKLVATSHSGKYLREVFELVYPFLADSDIDYVFFRDREGWKTIFKRRGFFVLIDSPYKPDVVDLWVMGRELERYLWGITWEG